jgi:tRNA A-37 threonylcarbamoyl transferase component Bud32
MKNLTWDEFNRLTKNAKTLTDDEYGKKVLELTDHSVLKLFRVKRLISQATLYSPARRFAQNAYRLTQLQIPTVKVCDLYNIKSIQRTAIHYQQLTGITVREYLQHQSHVLNEQFLQNLGQFIALLHYNGVFFRSAHFGNIIYTPDHQFGLIDISDMSISRFPLGPFKCLRNIKHIFRLVEDIQLIQQSQAIEHSYLQHCHIKHSLFQKKFLQISHHLKHQKY